jgi:hypothetical protein
MFHFQWLNRDVRLDFALVGVVRPVYSSGTQTNAFGMHVLSSKKVIPLHTGMHPHETVEISSQCFAALSEVMEEAWQAHSTSSAEFLY